MAAVLDILLWMVISINAQNAICWQAEGTGLLASYIREIYNGSEPEFLDTEPRKCEPISVPMCVNVINYKYTLLPNYAGHETQKEAERFMHQLSPLTPLNCYEYLIQFVCSAFLPMCVKDAHVLPCRSFCEEARKGCEPIINKFGYEWPEIMWCTRFPEYKQDSKNVCLLPKAPPKVFDTRRPTIQAKPEQVFTKISKSSNLCSHRERKASIVYGHTFASIAEVHRKKGSVPKVKLESLKPPVILNSKDQYIIRTLDGRTEYSAGKVVKLVSLCMRVKGARKITTTFTSGDAVVARTVMRINSTKITEWSNACICNNLALYVDRIIIQLRSLSGLPNRVGMVRNVEAEVCERTQQHFRSNE